MIRLMNLENHLSPISEQEDLSLICINTYVVRYRALNTLVAASLAAASCAPNIQSPLQGTLQDKFDDPLHRMIVLEVSPSRPNPSLGIRYSKIIVALPYEVAGSHKDAVNSLCGLDDKLRFSSILGEGERCYIDATAVKQGEVYKVTEVKDIKKVPYGFIVDQIEEARGKESRELEANEEAQKARDLLKPKTETWGEWISRLTGF